MGEDLLREIRPLKAGYSGELIKPLNFRPGCVLREDL